MAMRIKKFLLDANLKTQAPPHVLEYFMIWQKKFSHFVATLFYVFSSRSSSYMALVLVVCKSVPIYTA